jgi:hypothetical protein
MLWPWSASRYIHKCFARVYISSWNFPRDSVLWNVTWTFDKSIRLIDDDDSCQVPPLHGRKGPGFPFAEQSSSRNYMSELAPRIVLLPLESARCNSYSARHCHFATLNNLEGTLLEFWPSGGLRMHRCPVGSGRGASAADVIFADELPRHPEILDSWRRLSVASAADRAALRPWDSHSGETNRVLGWDLLSVPSWCLCFHSTSHSACNSRVHKSGWSLEGSSWLLRTINHSLGCQWYSSAGSRVPVVDTRTQNIAARSEADPYVKVENESPSERVAFYNQIARDIRSVWHLSCHNEFVCEFEYVSDDNVINRHACNMSAWASRLSTRMRESHVTSGRRGIKTENPPSSRRTLWHASSLLSLFSWIDF